MRRGSLRAFRYGLKSNNSIQNLSSLRSVQSLKFRQVKPFITKLSTSTRDYNYKSHTSKSAHELDDYTLEEDDKIQMLSMDPTLILGSYDSTKLLNKIRTKLDEACNINDYRPYTGKQFRELYPKATWYRKVDVDMNQNLEPQYIDIIKGVACDDLEVEDLYNIQNDLKRYKQSINPIENIYKVNLPDDAIVMASSCMDKPVYIDKYELKESMDYNLLTINV